MRTSASCRERGFTLIELTVVMVLLGMLYAVAAPALGKLHARLAFDSDRADLLSRIAALPVRAWASGEEGTLAELAARHGVASEGWRIEGGDAVYIRANGVCSGGAIRLLSPRGVLRVHLDPPFCSIGGAP